MSITPPSRIIVPSPLAQSSFSLFGTVIESPLPPMSQSPPSTLPVSGLKLVPANQNTALKFADVTSMINNYSQAPSKSPGTATMNMFSCFPRSLSIPASNSFPIFNVSILERHPYTTQTFIPMNLSSNDPSTKYLIIVAPTHPPTEAFPVLGPPDLINLKAFIANGAQAVTYGAGTWHAPMMVVGERKVDFVVVQFANGVQAEDCQEVKLDSEGIRVIVEIDDEGRQKRTKL